MSKDKKPSSSSEYFSIEELERELGYAKDVKTKWSHYIGEKTEVHCKMLVMLADVTIKMAKELMQWKGVKNSELIDDDIEDLVGDL